MYAIIEVIPKCTSAALSSADRTDDAVMQNRGRTTRERHFERNVFILSQLLKLGTAHKYFIGLYTTLYDIFVNKI